MEQQQQNMIEGLVDRTAAQVHALAMEPENRGARHLHIGPPLAEFLAPGTEPPKVGINLVPPRYRAVWPAMATACIEQERVVLLFTNPARRDALNVAGEIFEELRAMPNFEDYLAEAINPLAEALALEHSAQIEAHAIQQVEGEAHKRKWLERLLSALSRWDGTSDIFISGLTETTGTEGVIHIFDVAPDLGATTPEVTIIFADDGTAGVFVNRQLNWHDAANLAFQQLEPYGFPAADEDGLTPADRIAAALADAGLDQ